MCGKINRAASGTGGGPALHLLLTDPEGRAQIIGVQAATGLEIKEAGFPHVSYTLHFNSAIYINVLIHFYFISRSYY